MRTGCRQLKQWALLGLLAGCDASSNVVIIELANLPARAEKLFVTATLDGKPASSGMEITDPIDRFVVELPEDQSGHLVLDVQARDGEGCTHATVTPEYDLPLKATSTGLALSTQSPRRCGQLPPCSSNTACAIQRLNGVMSHIESMWALSPTDIWAAGHALTLLHWDGISWSAYDWGMSNKPNGDLYGIWGSAPNDVWAVGTFGLIIHYDGSRWATVSSPTALALYSVWGISKSEIYAVGQSSSPGTAAGVVLRYSGSSWTTITTAGLDTFNGVWADNSSGSTLIYACGNNGLLVRYDASKNPQWSSIVSNTTGNLTGIWGTRSTPGAFNHTLLAVGSNGTILRYRTAIDSAWMAVSSNTTLNFYGLRGNDAKQRVFAYGQSGNLVSGVAPYDSFIPYNGSLNSQIYTGAFSDSSSLVWLGGGSGSLGFIDLNP